MLLNDAVMQHGRPYRGGDTYQVLGEIGYTRIDSPTPSQVISGIGMEFKDLTIGQLYRFERELSGSLMGIKTGEAVKSGRKRYRYVKDSTEWRVNSVRVEVVPVTRSGTAIPT
jgi:hypothetical protein